MPKLFDISALPEGTSIYYISPKDPTNIKQKVGCLVPHEHILEVCDEQHMIFQEGDDVTFWITPQERIVTKFSQCDDPQLKDKTKADFLGGL